MFRKHHVLPKLVICVLSVACVALAWYQKQALGQPAYTTGYVLFAAILLLAGYNIRKKIPHLPLGNSATWMQIHIWVGVATLLVFGSHVGWRWPDGILEQSLAAIYLLTFSSGCLGLYLTRTIPGQLARVGEEVIYERIPKFRRDLRLEARALALEAVAASGTTTVADFYANRLYNYFERPRGWRYHLRPTSKVRRALLNEMQDLRRYLSDAERKLFEQLFALVRKKDDLDFHAARQGVLKSWLFAHVALTYVLLLVATLHGFVAHVYWGGAL